MQENQPTTRNALGGIEPTGKPNLKHEKLSPGDMIFALEMSIACAISYWVMTYGLAPFVGKDADFLGGMWAVLGYDFRLQGHSRQKHVCRLGAFDSNLRQFRVMLYLSLNFSISPGGHGSTDWGQYRHYDALG